MENDFNYLQPETVEEKIIWDYRFTELTVAAIKEKWDFSDTMSSLLYKYNVPTRQAKKRRDY
jgi:hypothetical protein